MGKYYADRFTPNELRSMSPDDLKWKPHPNTSNPGDFHNAKIAEVPLGRLKASVIHKPGVPPGVPQYEVVALDNGSPTPIPGINGSAADARSDMDKSQVMPRLAEIADSPENQASRGASSRVSGPTLF